MLTKHKKLPHFFCSVCNKLFNCSADVSEHTERCHIGGQDYVR